jgi:peptidyl-prolyl cis-trans isomerase A (cyclophilin A)
MKNLFTLAATAALLPLALFSQTTATTKSTTHATTATKSTTPKPAAAPALPAVDLPTDPGTYAVFYTTLGNFVCRLFPEDAPKTVANFVGLATGTKAWTDPKTQVL